MSATTHCSLSVYTFRQMRSEHGALIKCIIVCNCANLPGTVIVPMNLLAVKCNYKTKHGSKGADRLGWTD